MSEAKGEIEVSIDKIDISPNNCPLGNEVKLSIDFTSPVDLDDGWWDLKYVVDSAGKRHVIELGASAHTKYAKGKNTFVFSAPQVNIVGLEKHVLRNVGLFTAQLKNGTVDIIEIKLMTQVSKSKEGVLMRTIFNPLDE